MFQFFGKGFSSFYEKKNVNFKMKHYMEILCNDLYKAMWRSSKEDPIKIKSSL